MSFRDRNGDTDGAMTCTAGCFIALLTLAIIVIALGIGLTL